MGNTIYSLAAQSRPNDGPCRSKLAVLVALAVLTGVLAAAPPASAGHNNCDVPDPPPICSEPTPEDTTPPETTIDSGPGGATPDHTPTFTFSSNEPADASFQCAVDGGAFAACSSPHTTATLPPGTHTFKVVASDASGNTDASPATRTFEVVARSSEVRLQGGSSPELYFSDWYDQVNSVSAWVEGADVRVQDAAALLEAGAGCSQVDSHTASCPQAGLSIMRVTLGPGNDRLDLSPGAGRSPIAWFTQIDGGGGDDELRGGSGTDWFWAEDAPDGNDVFDGGEGASDRAVYGRRTSPVRVSIGSGGNGDTATGEDDLVKDTVENAAGGQAADELYGNDQANSLVGFYYYHDPDGGDRLDGNGGDDYLGGGPGEDALLGGSGFDRFDAGSGDDRIVSNDGVAERPDCGEGEDTAILDTLDTPRSCEMVDAPANTTSPEISGAARDGELLTAARGSWSGSAPITYEYRWRRCDASGEACADIAGATTSSYRLSAADVGRTLRVKVIATNRLGSSEASSAPTAVVSARRPASTAPPTIAGSARLGRSLTGSRGRWQGTAPIGYSYRWLRCNAKGAACRPISGATRLSYRLVRADVGRRLRFRVTAKNVAGSASATSAASRRVGG